MRNLDSQTVEGFGEEWNHYDQTRLSDDELNEVFQQYFRVFPWESLPENPVGFDLGCGSGRWAKHVAPRVAHLHCIDASEKALAVAERTLASFSNCTFHCTSVDEIPLADGSMDFGYSLGVLHHVPDTTEGIRSCVTKLKPGAPLLLYLYYRFDTRPAWFRGLWHASNALRGMICRLPYPAKLLVTKAIAATVYYPLARTARVLEHLGANVDAFPLSFYRDRSFYTMQTDALDRFGTRLEQRFTMSEIESMMTDAGLTGILFSDSAPYWCAVGFRK